MLQYFKNEFKIILKPIKYLVREVINTFEFFLIPFLSLLLPYKFYFPIYKFICRKTFFYKKYSPKLGNLQSGLLLNQSTWLVNTKLLHLIDISDFWLFWIRPKKAMRQLNVVGKWERKGGFIALGMHWGTGFGSMLHLKKNSLSPYFVFNNDFGSIKYLSFTEKAYRRMRRKYYQKITTDVVLTTGGGYQKIQDVLNARNVPILLFDAPRVGLNSKYFLNVFDRRYYLASGFINLICEEGVPYQLYKVRFDFDTGKKTIIIEPLKHKNNTSDLLDELGDYFEANIKESPESWYFWKQSKELLIESEK